MSNNHIINHPGIFSGLFEATANYGLVSTASFFACSGVADEKEIDFEVKLVANTSINNTLDKGYVYSLTGGRIIALNDGLTPIITYSPDSLIRVGKALDLSLNTSKKTGVVGLGSVIEQNKIPSPNPDKESQLKVVNQCHRLYLIKYIVPATKNMVKTHSLYVLGREVSLAGNLVDWDIKRKMPVVLVRGVSVTSGHQIGKNSPKSGPGPSTPGGRGRKLHQWSKDSDATQTPTPTPSGSGTPGSQDTSYKGKEKAVSNDESNNNKLEAGDDDNKDETPAPKKRGRPRKDILKDAAKRLKNH
ncbi:hypothetical protein PTTG_25809 [Puccinia triticina 1-1 BBBD Race 1]|uniref:Uncharacterized protein n=1 Tax=Puccinia triticina (isolate 1-1 / race 1 (BBBD)) TaxID=630390 RepID=A0A180H085_PUCT1|nr:hypothetical protein PTTG_25809 [Puccinia triticina 1-1 BBBD Race 1]